MPFSSITDPVDIARAHAAFEAAWTQVLKVRSVEGNAGSERDRLAYIVAGLVAVCEDEDEIVERAVAKYLA